MMRERPYTAVSQGIGLNIPSDPEISIGPQDFPLGLEKSLGHRECALFNPIYPSFHIHNNSL